MSKKIRTRNTDEIRNTDVEAAGASFVLAHYGLISRYAARMGGKAQVEVDDLVQDTILMIIERFEEFSPELCGDRPSAWIYWRVRECCTRLTRAAGYGRRLLSDGTGQGPSEDGPGDPLAAVPATRGSPRQMEATVRAMEIFASVSPMEFWAIQARVEGWDLCETQRDLGIRPEAQQALISGVAHTFSA